MPVFSTIGLYNQLAISTWPRRTQMGWIGHRQDHWRSVLHGTFVTSTHGGIVRTLHDPYHGNIACFGRIKRGKEAGGRACEEIPNRLNDNRTYRSGNCPIGAFLIS